MSKYKDLFLPSTHAAGEVNESMVFIGMVAIVGLSIIYIMSGIKQLKSIFKNRDHSFRQNTYILYKISVMMFLLYINYEIAIIILEIS